MSLRISDSRESNDRQSKSKAISKAEIIQQREHLR